MAIILILGLLILGFLIYKHRSKKERLSEVEKPREQPPEKHLPISRGKVVRPRDYEDYNKFQRDVFQRARLLAHLDRYEESLNQLQFFYNGVKKFQKIYEHGSANPQNYILTLKRKLSKHLKGKDLVGTADLTPYGGRNIEEYYNKVGNTIDNMLREKHKSSLDPKKFTKRVKGKHDSWRMFGDKQDLQVYKLDEEKITQVLDSNWKEKARNIVRVKAGLPKVGEGYKNETKLKRTIEGLLEPTGYEVKHHASPSWLGRQHLDIYIPEINLAVEYMGQQHYESLDFFGGEDRYKETKQRDKEKKTKCKKNNVKLIRYKYDEPIDPQKIAEKICNKSNLEIQKLDLNTEVPSDEELPTY